MDCGYQASQKPKLSVWKMMDSERRNKTINMIKYIGGGWYYNKKLPGLKNREAFRHIK